MRNLVGATIASCRAEIFVFGPDAVDPRKPQRVSLDLLDGSTVTFEAAQDGQSIRITDRRLVAVDLSPYGKTEIRESVPGYEWLSPGNIISAVDLLVDRWNVALGVKITTGGGSGFVYNWGDDLFVAVELPSSVAVDLSDRA